MTSARMSALDAYGTPCHSTGRSAAARGLRLQALHTQATMLAVLAGQLPLLRRRAPRLPRQRGDTPSFVSPWRACGRQAFSASAAAGALALRRVRGARASNLNLTPHVLCVDLSLIHI
eukprot:TRINITY_DN31816_c0_g1_i1.p2 TRINITY_DN31816_c0_g1~~TRINITY_DN31816_c0_g1_i1.p2  ORF type:complete len:118 (+),score=2.39 TRINITY_DN31816_c0_g1_i1:628-981(+)